MITNHTLKPQMQTRIATMLLTVIVAACSGPAVQPPSSSPDPTNVVTPSPSPVGPRFPYQEAACDTSDPKIAAAGLELPSGVGPEARIAAACMALEWLSRPTVDPSIVTEVRGPTVHPRRNQTDVAGLLAMERLVGHRYRNPGAPILLLVAGNDMEWACDYGRKNIDARIPRSQPWTEEWLGCHSKQWVCGGSNIELSDGTRFIFGACPKNIIDGTQPPPTAYKWNGLRSGHESIQILFYQLTGGDWGLPKGIWGGLIARSAGVQYFERAAAWLAGTPRDWRFDEAGSGQYESAKDAWADWRKTEAGRSGEFSFTDFVTQDWASVQDPDATLLSSVSSFAGEYLVAHHGIEALFTWLSGSATIEQTFGVSEDKLFATLGTYVQAQFEGLSH